MLREMDEAPSVLLLKCLEEIDGPVCQVQGAECDGMAEPFRAFRNAANGWRGQEYFKTFQEQDTRGDLDVDRQVRFELMDPVAGMHFITQGGISLHLFLLRVNTFAVFNGEGSGKMEGQQARVSREF